MSTFLSIFYREAPFLQKIMRDLLKFFYTFMKSFGINFC